MNAERSAAWVRRWVNVYTRGLPAEIRQQRRDEIDDDLWCQAQDAAIAGRPDRSLGDEVLARFLFGIPADLSWRAEQIRAGRSPTTPGRSYSMNAPGRGLLAILGGTAWAIGIFGQSLVGREYPPQASLWMVIMVGGIWMLAGATIGLGFIAVDRIRLSVGLLASLGALLGALSLLGPYAAIVALPISSAALLWELRRIGAVGPWTARAHVVAAAFVLIVTSMVWINPSFVSNLVTSVLAFSLAIPYGLSWIAIGWSLLRGRLTARDAIGGAGAA